MYRILRPTVQGSSVLLRSRALRRFATAPAGPLARYRELVEAGAVSEDEQQLATLQSFDRLYRELVVYRPPGLAPAFTPRAAPAKKEESFWGSLFSSKPDPKPDIVHTPASVASPNGIYLYGGPGCGKTFMMDLFYETLPLERKRRIHFNDFMIETHKQLHLLKRSSSRADYILDSVTDDLIKKHYVLCFDEFQVTDIADAMLLKNMFTLLFNKGIVVVATSNRAPMDLYLDGIQRDLFLPFCHTLQRRSEVIRMREMRDYRMIKHETQEKKNVYFTSKGSDAAYEKTFKSHLSGRRLFAASLTVYGHNLNLPVIAAHPFKDYVKAEREEVSDANRIANSKNANIARFTFAQLCDDNIGAADFIAISELFDIVFLERIPQLNTDSRNQIRRFITLVDALYEARVIVVIQAATPANLILDVSKETKQSSLLDELFSFDRCVSRLLEMQSEEYINGCAAFREANIREKNVAGTNRNEKGRPAVLPHSTEVSLSLQDVSTYYSPWDLESRQLHLQPPSNQLLLQAWRDEVLVLGDACDRSGITLPVPPSVPSTNAEDNIIVHLNHLLDPAAGLPRLPLSAVYSIVQRVVKDQTGVDSFVPSSTTVSQLLHLLQTYDIVHESHKIVGSKHNYHFRRRSSKEADKHRGFFSFNAFVAAIHKHPIIILL